MRTVWVHGMHCRFLVPDNTQKILTEIWHHFWLKNDGEKWSRKKYFKIPWWPSEVLLSSAKNLPRKAELAWQVSRYLWRPQWNFKIIFSRPLFIIIFKPKMVSNLRKNFLCIVWHQKPTVFYDAAKNSNNWVQGTYIEETKHQEAIKLWNLR